MLINREFMDILYNVNIIKDTPDDVSEVGQFTTLNWLSHSYGGLLFPIVQLDLALDDICQNLDMNL